MIDRFSRFMVNAIAPAFGLLLSLWLIWNVETRFFHVVDDFMVSSIVKTGQGYIAYGELTKERNCEFVGLTLYAVNGHAPKLLVAQYKKDIFGSDVGMGRQTWGPITVALPREAAGFQSIEVQGVHRCHALWLQTTEYTTIDIGRLP